jgi:hypothetical protein
MLAVTLILTILIIASGIVAMFVFLFKGIMEKNNAHFKKALLILIGSWALVMLINVINLLLPDAWQF